MFFQLTHHITHFSFVLVMVCKCSEAFRSQSCSSNAQERAQLETQDKSHLETLFTYLVFISFEAETTIKLRAELKQTHPLMLCIRLLQLLLLVFIVFHLNWIKWNAMEINVLFRDKANVTQIDLLNGISLRESNGKSEKEKYHEWLLSTTLESSAEEEKEH